MIRASLALVFVAFAAFRAGADPATADKLAAEATDMVGRGDYKNAAAKFSEAYVQDPTRHVLYCNIGISYIKARELPRAHLILTQCLTRTALDKSFIDLARTALAQVEDTLRASGHTPITVSVSPRGTSVSVKELGVESTFVGARTIWLAFGEYHLLASADGHASQDVAITAADQTPKTVEITLKPGETKVVDRPTTKVIEGKPRSKVPAIVATGVTVVAAGIAVLAFGKAHTAADDAAFAIDRETFDDESGKVSTWNTVMGVSGAIAVVGAAASTYLWIRATRKTRLEVTPTGGGANVMLRGSF